MSWSVSVTGRAAKMAEVVKDRFVTTAGCPKGSAEEAAKNALGEIAENLCKSLIDGNSVVTINAQGSAWNEGDKARSQYCKFEFSHVGSFIE